MADDQAQQIEVLNPQGQAGNIPLEQMDDALGQGYKLSKHTIMYDPQGKRGLVPKEQMADAMKAGYQTTPKTTFEKERTEGPRGVWNALKGMVPEDPTGGHSPFEKEFWLGKSGDWKVPGVTEGLKEGLTAPGTAYSTLTRPLPSDLPTDVLSTGGGGQKSTLGRGIYRGASLFAPVAGVSPENMEAASGRADTSGVATQAAVPAGLAIGGPFIEKGAAALGRRYGAGSPRALAKATQEIKEAAPPGRHEINYDAQLERARPYLAAEQRTAPVTTVREAHEVANQAVKGIEDKIGSYIEQLPETDRISGQEILDRAAEKLNDPNSPRTPAERAAGMRALQEFLTDEIPPEEEGGEPTRAPKDLSVKETDRLRWRFNRDMDTEMGMTEADRADVRASNPRFAAKEAAAEAMRDAVYDKLEEAGVPGVRELRQDEGAVIQMRDAFRRNITRAEKSNAPSAFRRLGVFGPVGLGLLGETMASRLGLPPGLSAALGVGSAGLYEYLRNRMTPNPLMERGFGRLGRSGLAPNFPTMPIQGEIVPEPGVAGAAPPVAREAQPNFPQLTEFAGREPGAPPPVTTGARELVGEPEEKILAQRKGTRQPIRGLLAGPEVAPEPVAPPNAAGTVEDVNAPDETILARRGGIRQPVRGLLPETSGVTPPPANEPPPVKVNQGSTTIGKGGRTPKKAPAEPTKPTAKLEKLEAGKTPAYVSAAAKEAGAMPGGYQPGEHPGMGFFQFHDPELGGSFYVREGQVSAKAIKDAMEARRGTIEPSPLVEEKTENVKKEMARREAEELEPKEEERKPATEEFSQEQIEDAEAGIRQELETRQFERPRRMPIIESRGGNQNENFQEITGWKGIRGVQNAPLTQGFSPSEIEVALRRKAGRVYDTLIRRAARSTEEIEAASNFTVPEEPEGVLPGLGEHVKAQEEGAARVRGEQMTGELGRPLGSIEEAAGEMERKSPLFRGTAASPQGELAMGPQVALPREDFTEAARRGAGGVNPVFKSIRRKYAKRAKQ